MLGARADADTILRSGGRSCRSPKTASRLQVCAPRSITESPARRLGGEHNGGRLRPASARQKGAKGARRAYLRSTDPLRKRSVTPGVRCRTWQPRAEQRPLTTCSGREVSPAYAYRCDERVGGSASAEDGPGRAACRASQPDKISVRFLRAFAAARAALRKMCMSDRGPHHAGSGAKLRARQVRTAVAQIDSRRCEV